MLRGTTVHSMGRMRMKGVTITASLRFVISGSFKPVKSQMTIAPRPGWILIAILILFFLLTAFSVRTASALAPMIGSALFSSKDFFLTRRIHVF